jgi:hypothetical protein
MIEVDTVLTLAGRERGILLKFKTVGTYQE